MQHANIIQLTWWGDTTSSYSGLIISISVIGTVAKNKITHRSGAKENDLLIVSGDVGSSYLGLDFERENGVFNANPNIQPKLDGYDELIKKQYNQLPEWMSFLCFKKCLLFRPL